MVIGTIQEAMEDFKNGTHDFTISGKCSNCEYTSFEEYNFCCNCGADMRGNNDGE